MCLFVYTLRMRKDVVEVSNSSFFFGLEIVVEGWDGKEGFLLKCFSFFLIVELFECMIYLEINI